MVGLGGLNVALAMGPGRPAVRMRWGVATALAGAAATGLATLVHPIGWLSVIVAFVVVAIACTLRALGPDGALVGFVISAVYVITNGLPGVATEAPARAAQFLVGGAVAVVLMVVAGLVQGDEGRAGRPAVSVLSALLRSAPEVRQHSLTVAATVAGTTVLYRALELDFGYWIPLTALAVLQPAPHASRVRLIQRASGTGIGCLVVLIAVLVSADDALLVSAVGVSSFGLFLLRERSYHWLVLLLTPTALLMISTVDFEGTEIVAERIIDTAVGLVVALAVVGLSTLRRGAASVPGDGA